MRIFSNTNTTTAAGVAANLNQMAAATPSLCAAALYQAGQELKNQAMPLTPLRDKNGGSLRRSAFVSLPEMAAGGLQVRVGYDGRSAPYALFVHEMTGQVNWSEPGTGAKFLERPFDEMRGSLARNIGGMIATMLERNHVPKPSKK